MHLSDRQPGDLDNRFLGRTAAVGIQTRTTQVLSALSQPLRIKSESLGFGILAAILTHKRYQINLFQGEVLVWVRNRQGMKGWGRVEKLWALQMNNENICKLIKYRPVNSIW